MLELPEPPEWATRARTWLPAERPTVPTVAVLAEAEAVGSKSQMQSDALSNISSLCSGSCVPGNVQLHHLWLEFCSWCALMRTDT